MADIDILVNSSQVKTAKQELQELGNSFNSASKSASIFMQAFERAAKQSQRDEQYIRQTSQALQRLINDNLKITNAYKSAEQSASAFTEGLRKQEAQALKTAQANQAAINKQLGVGGPSATGSGAGFGALDAEIERLRQKYDQVYSASRLYESSLNELNRAHMLGVTSTKQHESAVEQLNFEYQQFSNAAEGAILANNRFSQHVNESGRGLNKFGLYAQQVGYQVGDFFVQIQSGTNVLVAFGQQATQLAGLFPGVLGAALGIGISLATAIGAAFMRISENAESAANGVLSLADAQKQLNEAAGDYALKLEMLRFGVDTQSEAVALKEILELTTQIQGLNREYQQTESLSRRQSIAEEVLGLKEQLSTQQSIVDEVNSKRQAYETALAINKQMLAVELAHARAIGDAKREQDGMTEAAQDALGKYSMMRTVAAGIANEMARAAANTQAAANAALTAMRMEFSPAGGAMAQYGGRGATSDRPITNQYGDVITLPGSNRPRSRPTDIDFGLPDVGSGGGRAEARLKKQIDLTNQLTEAERERLSVIKSVEGSLEDGFMVMVEGTESVKDAFKKMAYEVIKELYRVLVVQRLVGGISSGIGMLFGKSTGSFGLPFGRASGGSIMPGQSYLVGENGPELVIPRHSGTVVNANQTAGGSGGNGGFTQNLTISVTGSDSAMVRAEVAKMIPQITNATKAAVIDARLRGGQMKAAFS